MDALARMPGDAEYRGAIAQLTEHSVGDRLHFSLPGDWRCIAARVALVRETDGWLCVEAENGEGFHSISPDWVRSF